MITHFVEVTDLGAYGKFLLARLDDRELITPSMMPDANGARLLTYGGRRRLNAETTMVYDLQRATGAAWPLEGGKYTMFQYHHQHLAGLDRLVCPMYLPFVQWLYERGDWARGAGDITTVPCYLELKHAAYEGAR